MMKNIVISLFDYTGVMVKPWLDAGYECWIVDKQHPANYANSGVTECGGIFKVNHDLKRPWLLPFGKERVAFVAAFPPCDHLSVSGVRDGSRVKGFGCWLRVLKCSLRRLKCASG